MNLLGTVRRIWGSGEDEDEENNRTYNDAENDDYDPDYSRGSSSSSYSGYDSESSYDSPDYSSSSLGSASSKYGSSASPAGSSGRSSYAGNFASSGASTGASSSPLSSPGASSARLRAMNPTLRSREKNIYTIKPKRLDEATVAADCLKTGSAVIVNLEAVDRVTAVRIVDFMSGVCYGIDGAQGQNGHAMKLGEMIFLFTPAEFEISSDETDYAANSDHFFREISGAQSSPSSATPQIAVPQSGQVGQGAPQSAASAPASANSSFASSYNTPDYTAERRAWER